MNTSNQNIRTHILQMIKQCSSFSNLEESNSVGYAGLNQDELKELLYETFHSHCGLDKVEFLSSTPISQVINIIIRKMPVGIINDRTYQISDETSCSYSQSCDFSEPASISLSSLVPKDFPSPELSSTFFPSEEASCIYCFPLFLKALLQTKFLL